VTTDNTYVYHCGTCPDAAYKTALCFWYTTNFETEVNC